MRQCLATVLQVYAHVMLCITFKIDQMHNIFAAHEHLLKTMGLYISMRTNNVIYNNVKYPCA